MNDKSVKFTFYNRDNKLGEFTCPSCQAAMFSDVFLVCVCPLVASARAQKIPYSIRGQSQSQISFDMHNQNKTHQGFKDFMMCGIRSAVDCNTKEIHPVENRKFYWMQSPILSVGCKNATGECPLLRLVENAGAEYRYNIDGEGVKSIYCEYFPNKAPNIDEDAMVRNMITACKQCYAQNNGR